jgi:hypothetical protein
MAPVNLYIAQRYMLISGVGNFWCPRIVEGRCRSTGVSVCRQTQKLLLSTVSSGNIQCLPYSTVVISGPLTVASCLSFSPVPIIRSNFHCLPATNLITACMRGLLNWFVTLEYTTASVFNYLISCEWVNDIITHDTSTPPASCFLVVDVGWHVLPLQLEFSAERCHSYVLPICWVRGRGCTFICIIVDPSSLFLLKDLNDWCSCLILSVLYSWTWSLALMRGIYWGSVVRGVVSDISKELQCLKTFGPWIWKHPRCFKTLAEPIIQWRIVKFLKSRLITICWVDLKCCEDNI